MTLSKSKFKSYLYLLVQSCGIKLPNLRYLFIADFGTSIPFTFWTTSLSVTVSMVVTICSQKEMLRVYTGFIVTYVADQQITRNGTISQFPRNAMGLKRNSQKLEASIASQQVTTCPFPALALDMLILDDTFSLKEDIAQYVNRTINKVSHSVTNCRLSIGGKSR